MRHEDVPLHDPPVRYRIRSSETWEKARADYVAGMPAPSVGARYDIGLSALRARARAEGWRRVDLEDPDPVDLDDPYSPPRDLAALAWARTQQAVARGRALDAQRWVRLFNELTDVGVLMKRGYEAMAAREAAAAPAEEPEAGPAG